MQQDNHSRVHRFCKELLSKQGIDPSLCGEKEVFDIVIRLYRAVNEKYKLLNELLDRVAESIEDGDIGMLSQSLAELLDELIAMIDRRDEDTAEELSCVLMILGDVLGVETPQEIEEVAELIAGYEVFLEQVKQRLIAIADLLRSIAEQTGAQRF
ncbi:MAG: hypothetical protein QXY39_03480 [Thermofilaceae archaeon]